MDALPSLDDEPLWIAHRGAAALAPENTLAAYRAAWASGLRVLEQDVRLLADGTPVVLHDATVERTTLGHGAVASMDRATFDALRARPFDGFPPDVAPPTFDAVLAEFRGRAVFVPEAKSPGSGGAVVAALQRHAVPPSQALVQAFALEDLLPAIAAGYPAMFLTRSQEGIADARAAGVQWAGLDRRANDAVFAAWHDAGFRIVAYTVNDRAERDRLLALGVRGFFSDDPIATMRD